MARATSEREARNYDCPRLGKPVVVSYLYETNGFGRGAPRGVHCAGALDCGVETVTSDGSHTYDWTLCPLYGEFIRDGFLQP